jgi:hypothetical protein
MTLRLYHRTCAHRVDQILETGTLLPFPHALLGVKMVWLTHIPWAKREALALSSDFIRCDRMEFLFEVTDPTHVVPWVQARTQMSPSVVRMLEAARGARPDYWWVSGQPQPVKIVLRVPA